MIEQNTVAGKQPVTFSIDPCGPVGVEFGHSVGASRLQWRAFILDPFGRVAVEFTCGSVVEASVLRHQSYRLKHSRCAQSGHITSRQRLLKRSAYKALRCEVVTFVWGRNVQRLYDRAHIGKVHRDQLHFVVDTEALKSPEVGCGKSPKSSEDFIPLFQEKLGEVGSVLTRYSRD